jgi:hypothetical protein
MIPMTSSASPVMPSSAARPSPTSQRERASPPATTPGICADHATVGVRRPSLKGHHAFVSELLNNAMTPGTDAHLTTSPPDGDDSRRLLSLSGIRAHDVRTMGDKSPKSMRKQADQKQSKTNEDSRRKQAAVTAKQVATKKK